jgi:hypothetical protein
MFVITLNFFIIFIDLNDDDDDDDWMMMMMMMMMMMIILHSRHYNKMIELSRKGDPEVLYSNRH